MQTISVIIPAYNEEKYLKETLVKVIKYKTPNVVEILVIDNASSDGTSRVALEFPEIRLIKEPVRGLTKARQRGLLEASGDLLAFIDADTHVSPTWFGIVNKEFSANPNLVCLSGPYSYENVPGWQKFLISLYWGLIAKPTYFFTKYMVAGGNFIARKNALLKIGGFDSNIEFFGEDTDIARRLHEIGKVQFQDEMEVSTSARRFVKEGLVRTGIKYGMNYYSMALFKKPFHKKHDDIR